jgi:2,4-dienoyl-CoA reductase-like NADH-dependent reductase (Old Yellow Enzyme family)/thioredoxin reductase
MKTDFPLLFSPKLIGNIMIKNRILMAPIDTNLADESGKVTDDLVRFYERRAAGGPGMIIVENTQVDYPRGKNTRRQLSIHDDEKIPGLARVAESIRTAGCVPAIQLHHAGRETTLEITGGILPVAPSPLPCGHLKTPVRELSRPEIEELIQAFIHAAERAKQAGFELIEIHGAHGYLVGGFFSPHTNRRTDEYGGSLDGRMRFATQIMRGIKRSLGMDFPVSFRFSADEFVSGGIDLEEGIRIAQRLENEGVDVLHVSAGIYESLPTLLEPMSYPQGWRAYLASEVKKLVHIPVIAVGVIREPSFAENLLSEEKCDFVAVGRGLLSDPDWPKKAWEGRVREIRRCIGCNTGCLSERLSKAIRCSINPETGREKSFPASKRRVEERKVVVVGAGPAGLEAARTAAINGCSVTVFEEKETIGGQLQLAAVPPGKEKIRWLIEYYENEMMRLGIDLRMGQPAGVDSVLRMGPNAVLIATGSLPLKPPVSLGGTPVFTVDEILSSKYAPKGRVAMIGGGAIGCETALYLHSIGAQVHLYEREEELALDFEPITAWDLKERIVRSGVQVRTGLCAREIRRDALVFSTKEGVLHEETFDAVVWAAGRTPYSCLSEELKKAGFLERIYVIGDALSVGRIHTAIDTGYLAASEL